MGLLQNLSKKILYCIIAFFLIIYLPGLPPHTTFPFTEFEITSPRKLKGALEPNFHLDNAERLLEGRVYGPECLIARNNEIYMGIHGGEVIKLNAEHITHVTKLGQPCEDILEECRCGRPLGLAFDSRSDSLIIADAYYGIWRVDISTGKKKLLISPHVELPGKSFKRKAKIFNDIAVDKYGDIYWTDSSSDFLLQDLVYSFLANPSGRLFKYNRDKNESQLLLDELFFANGVALSPNEDFLIVAESGNMRLIKYYLEGNKAGKSEVFIDGLPGIPDNLTPDKDGIWVPLIIPVDEDHPNAFIILTRFPTIRLFLCRFLSLLEMPFQFLNNIYPNKIAQRFIHFIGHGESLSILHHKRSTIVRLDWNGNIIGSLHGFDKSVGHVSHVLQFHNDLILGSPFNHFLARVKTPKSSKKHNVQIKNIQYKNIEVESESSTVEPKNVVFTTPNIKQKVVTSQNFKNTDKSQEILTKTTNLEKNTRTKPKEPAPVIEDINVDTHRPKQDKLKIINKDKKHVEL